ncbi:MAG: peptidoglycan-binding protein [Nannocystaceae bacterium]|nr:peptidoglycan-binding protein [Nannocystaceae bacterium]
MAEPERWLNLVLADSTGAPLGGREYALSFDGGAEQRGTLDGDGRLAVAVPAGARGGTLVVAFRRFALAFDALPPAHTVAGAQERLNHLHVYSGPVDGELGPMTKSAIERFQRQQRLSVTGALDDETVTQLVRAHGS